MSEIILIIGNPQPIEESAPYVISQLEERRFVRATEQLSGAIVWLNREAILGVTDDGDKLRAAYEQDE